jgi:chemotaxis protein methyltransferase CheR
MTPVATEQLAALAAMLKERVGLHIRPDSFAALRLAVLARLDVLAATTPDAPAYLSLLGGPDGDEELRQLLPLVTVGKTSFFRDERQFRALDALLPGFQERSGDQRLRIWSAGCATGEEPYSIAMTCAERGLEPRQLELLATDVNPEAVAAAARGLYEARRVRDIPTQYLARHFDREGDAWRVRASLRRYITAIRPHNLVSVAFPAPQTTGWDVIFCRNVIIYFDTPTTRRVLEQFHHALAPGGWLFLGYSESLFRLFDGFDLTEVNGAFLYRKPEEGSVRPVALHVRPAPSSLPSVRHVHLPAAPARPARTTDTLPLPLAPAAPPAPAQEADGDALLAPQEFLDGAIALVSEGRFGAARELLERHLEQNGPGLAVQLTLANLYGVLRQHDRARDAYQGALSLEPLSAEAHLFYGIHLLSQAEADAAATELSRALFLDPDLALAHYYLGRSREAQRDPQRARLAYRNTIEALKRLPSGKRQAFLGYYPDIPEDGAAFVRAAEYALAAL